jgi:hypothetical protein
MSKGARLTVLLTVLVGDLLRVGCPSSLLAKRYLQPGDDQGASDKDLGDGVNRGAHIEEEEKDYCRILQLLYRGQSEIRSQPRCRNHTFHRHTILSIPAI